LKQIIKRIIKRVVSLNKKKWRNEYDQMLQLDTAEEKFKLIYQKNLWRNTESISGSGSTLNFTKNIRESLPEIVNKYKINSMFDAPCGDFNWMKHALKTFDVNYIGGDIVSELIEKNNKNYSQDNVKFISIDLITGNFPETDMMLCRDCLFHVSYKDTLEILKNFIASNTKYLFTTTFNKPDFFVNEDIVTGNFRGIDLAKPPYNFPTDAVYSVLDGKKDNVERYMSLWEREQIITAVDLMTKDLDSQ